MRLVLDTNVALSGLLWTGTPAKLIDADIVSGDVHLTKLGRFAGIPIMSAQATFIRCLHPEPDA